MKKLNLFAQLMKVDVEKRQVWGRATQEVPDKSGEIFDYATSVPYFKDWSASFEKATEIFGEEGKSLGNIRAMHGKVAAGKVIAIDFNDVEKAIDIGTEITDDAEWAKVLKGTYTGFSIGGGYEKRWKDTADGGLARFTANPSEISIVDNPCVGTATFTMVKVGGAVEQVPFEPASAETIAAEATKAFLAEHQAELDAHIAKAIANAKPAAAAPLAKGLYSVSSLADVLTSIRYLCADTQGELEWEGDNSKVPEQLREWLKTGVGILLAMTEEESAEMVSAVTPVDVPILLAAKSELEKVTSAGAALQKVADGALAKVAELEKSVATLTAEKATLAGEKDTLEKKVTALEAIPAAPKGVTRVVAKAAETITAENTPAEQLIDPASPTFALDVMKAALKSPIAGRSMPARP